MNKNKFISVALLAFCPLIVNADPILSIGGSQTVTSADYEVGFDPLGSQQGVTTSSYEEDGLTFQAVIGSFQLTCQVNLCGGFFQNSSGPGILYNAGRGVRISATDGSLLGLVELVLGTGYGGSSMPGYFQTYRDGSLTGSGAFVAQRGSFINVSDVDGFDELRVGSFISTCTVNIGPDASCAAATAIDNVYANALGVPEPGTLALLALGLAGIGASRRRNV